MIIVFGKQFDFLGAVPFEGTVVQNKATPVWDSGLLMYRLNFHPDDRSSKQRGESVPVDLWGL
jgi:hypothetical protein